MIKLELSNKNVMQGYWQDRYFHLDIYKSSPTYATNGKHLVFWQSFFRLLVLVS